MKAVGIEGRARGGMQEQRSSVEETTMRGRSGIGRRRIRGVKPRAALVALLGLALALRLYGIGWDDGYLFHPDERKIFMVVDDLHLPSRLTWKSLLTPDSPLNPRFFAYGSFPMYLLKIVAYGVGRLQAELPDIHSMYLVGRPLSTLFDIGTLVLLFSLGTRLYGRRVGLLSAAFVGVAVLHIQLSHFYAVDTILTFFVVFTVHVALFGGRRSRLLGGVWLGLGTGLALATKLSAAPLLLVDLMAWGYWAREFTWNKPPVDVQVDMAPLQDVSTNLDNPTREQRRFRASWRWLCGTLGGFSVTMLVALLVFALAEPYGLLDYVSLVVDALAQSGMATGRIDAPYTRQFWGRAKYLYEIQQMVIWSLGIPLGVTALAGTLFVLVRGLWRRCREDVLLLVWPVAYFAITGLALAKFMRYMLPVIPFLCLFAARFLYFLVRRARSRWAYGLARTGVVLVLATTGLYALSFMNVYAQTHPWIEMTKWICESLPADAALTYEHWDDPLPLIQPSGGTLDCWGRFHHVKMAMYDKEDETKLEWLIDGVLAADYIVLSTNRLYGTIPRLQERYPIGSQYYRSLYNGELGFELAHYVAVHPKFGPVTIMSDTFRDPGLVPPPAIRDSRPSPFVLDLGHADESYVVYDHPMPLVFRKVRSLPRAKLRELFAEGLRQVPASADEARTPYPVS